MEIIKDELYKLFSNIVLYSVVLIFTAAYAYTTNSYYMNNKTISFERMISFPYKAGSVFIGALIILMLSNVFTGEYNMHTDSIILCTKNGRKNIVTYKIISSIIFIVILNTFFYVFNFIINCKYAGINGYMSPIQKLISYKSSPYNFTCLQYYIIEYFISTLASIAFAIFILFLSVINKSILSVLFTGSMAFIIPYFIHDIPLSSIKKLDITWVMKNLFYTDFMRVRNLFNRLRIYNIFGVNIEHKNIIYIFMTFVSAAFLYAIYDRFKKLEVS